MSSDKPEQTAAARLAGEIITSLDKSNLIRKDAGHAMPVCSAMEMVIKVLERNTQPAQPITAIAGPPTREALEAAGDDDLWLVQFDSDSMAIGDRWYLRSKSSMENPTQIKFKWHVYLGPITPPAPDPEMPKCSECGKRMKAE
jgi:hypothetical protein